MKCPQAKFHVDIMSDSQVIRSKKVKIIIMSKFIVRSNTFCSSFFLFIDILL